MDKLDFIIERLHLLEQRMALLEGARGMDRDHTILAMQEMSKTIGMMMAQLLPIIEDRRIMKKVREDAIVEQIFEGVKRTQKYPM